MNRKVLRTGWLCTGCALLLALAGGCTQDEPAAPGVATTQEPRGDVKVAPGGALARSAPEGTQLYTGDVVTTGSESRVTVRFVGGQGIEMDANASLSIGEHDVTAARYGVVLLSGRARASSSTNTSAVKVSFGTPFGVLEIGDDEAEIEVDSQTGVRVLVGTVVLTTDEGAAFTMEAGQVYTLDGLTVQPATEQDSESTMVLDPLTFVLLSNPRQTLIRRAGESQWTTPSKREVLRSGDALRTHRGARNTRLQAGEHAALRIDASTVLTVEDGGKAEGAQRATYNLQEGNVGVELTAQEGMEISQMVRVGGRNVRVIPGLRSADVEIRAGRGGRGQVLVRSGAAQIDDGDLVHAGMAVILDEGDVTARPIAHALVELRPQSNAIVYFDTSIPPVAFAWPDGDGAPYEFAIAADQGFEEPVYEERLQSARLVHDALGPGRYYWRVRHKDSWLRGRVDITKSRPSSAASLRRKNIIDDTGEKTVVYFQRTLPDITVRWKPVPGAASYMLKVFADGEFDAPKIQRDTRDTTFDFNSGDFQEGRYYWHIVGLDGDGRELLRGRMNNLEIAFDNVVTELQVRTPISGARVDGKTLETKGDVQPGATLHINGRKVALDDQGRFRHTIPVERGANQIVYKTVANDGIERFHLFTVYRRR